MENYPRISHRQLNMSQRRTLRRVLRYYRDRTSYSKCTSVRFELRRIPCNNICLKAWTRRSDCGKYSPRQILCAHEIHAFIRRRGKLMISRAENGLVNDSRHVARMLKGHIWKP